MKTLLILQRLTGSGKPRTFGELLSGAGEHIVYTLEDMVREVAGKPVLDWKVKHETAIRSGLYRITLETSNRFGPGTLTVNSVEGFDGVRMHGGNTERDTDGCPLLGMNRTDAGINTCLPAVDKVKAIVRAEIAAGNEVWLDIRNLKV